MNISKDYSLTAQRLVATSKSQPHMKTIKRRLARSIQRHRRELQSKAAAAAEAMKQAAEATAVAAADANNDDGNRQKRSDISLLKRWSRIAIVCARWCAWAQRNYKINAHRFISFAHITQTTRFREDVHVDFFEQLNAQKRRAQMDSPELEVNKRLIEDGRIRAEMMNFNVDYFKSLLKTLLT